MIDQPESASPLPRSTEGEALRAQLRHLDELLKNLYEGDNGSLRPDRHFMERTLHEARAIIDALERASSPPPPVSPEQDDDEGVTRSVRSIDFRPSVSTQPATERLLTMDRKDISAEMWREYDFGGRVYRIDSPQALYIGTTTHRVLADGVVHCVPSPGVGGCVLRWKPRDVADPVQF